MGEDSDAAEISKELSVALRAWSAVCRIFRFLARV